MYYALIFKRTYDGTKEECIEVYRTLEDLLSDVDEFSLKKGEFRIYDFVEMDPLNILSRFSQEIGEYDEKDKDENKKDEVT